MPFDEQLSRSAPSSREFRPSPRLGQQWHRLPQYLNVEDAAACTSSPGGLEDDSVHDEVESIQWPDEPLEEDTFGHGAALLIRESRWLAEGTHYLPERVVRLVVSSMLLLGTVILQVGLLIQVKRLLSARAVHKIRQVYSDYEVKMYPNATVLVDKGHLRGVPGRRRDSNFELLTSDEKDLVCEIPLSQPHFLMLVLSVWTMTCLSELRKIFEVSYRILRATPTVPSMRKSCRLSDRGHEVHVVGLTRTVKVLIFSVVTLPRVAVTAALLWLGCRWLTATPALSELLLNAVALEFVMLLKDSMYRALVPGRGKFETPRTFIAPATRREAPSSLGFLGVSALLTAASTAWVVMYVYFWQEVLPDYRWDVQDICLAFMEESSQL